MSTSHKATVENRGSKYMPILTDSDIDPDILVVYENTCQDHFEEKGYAAADQVKKILGGLQGALLREWFTADRARIQGLSFLDFMSEIRLEFLDNNWEDTAEQSLLAMAQGEDTFKDFCRRLEVANAKLSGTPSHLDKTHRRQQLTAGMSAPLCMHVNNSSAPQQTDYKKWKEEVRKIDDVLVATYAEFAEVLKKQRLANRTTSILAEPSRKANTAPSSNNGNKGSSSSSTTSKPPQLTAKEKGLLMKYRGCFKCRRLDQSHQSRDCPNGFPSGVGYRELSQSDVPAGCKPEPDRKVVAAVREASRARSASPQRGRRTSSGYPQAREYSLSQSPSERPHPVAAVLGSSRNTFSTPPNRSNVLQGSSSDGEEVCHVIAAVITEVPSVAVPSVGHLWWKAVGVPDGDALPVPIHALLDTGSHLYLNPSLLQLAARRRMFLSRMLLNSACLIPRLCLHLEL